jgi:hypothetical protein
MSFAINRFSGFAPQSLTSAMNDVVEGVAASLKNENSASVKMSTDAFQTFDPGLTEIKNSTGAIAEVADFSTPTSYLPGGVSSDWDQVVTNLNNRSFDIGGNLNSFVRSLKGAQMEGIVDDRQASTLGRMNSRVNDFVDLYRQLGEAIGSFMWLGPMSD